MSKRIFTFSGQLISCTTIARVQLEYDFVYFYLITGEKIKSMLSIESLLNELPKNYFVKLNNHVLINKFIAKRIKIKNDNYIYFPDGFTMKISQAEYKLLRKTKNHSLTSAIKENVLSLFM